MDRGIKVLGADEVQCRTACVRNVLSSLVAAFSYSDCDTILVNETQLL